MNDELRKLRTAHDLSQQALSKLSGVGRFKISSAERGYSELSPTDKAKIDRAINKLTKIRGKSDEQQQD